MRDESLDVNTKTTRQSYIVVPNMVPFETVPSSTPPVKIGGPLRDNTLLLFVGGLESQNYGTFR